MADPLFYQSVSSPISSRSRHPFLSQTVSCKKECKIHPPFVSSSPIIDNTDFSLKILVVEQRHHGAIIERDPSIIMVENIQQTEINLSSKFIYLINPARIKSLIERRVSSINNIVPQLRPKLLEMIWSFAEEHIDGSSNYGPKSIEFLVTLFVKTVYEYAHHGEEEEEEEDLIQRVAAQSMEQARFVITPASRNSIESFNSKIFDKDDSQAPCSICREEFLVDITTVTELPCLHIFHQPCIVGWLNIKNTCPLCRTKMPTD